MAFVNTRFNARSGVVDQLATPAAAAAWLHSRGLVATEPKLSRGQLVALADLRALAHTALSARIGGGVPPATVVAALNHHAQAAPLWPRLSWVGESSPTVSWQTASGTALERAAAAIARDVADTVSGSRGGRLLQCQAPGCVRLLLRDRPQRVWCSIQCGDRVRAARHYGRRRADRAT